jgi:hypothetical protein
MLHLSNAQSSEKMFRGDLWYGLWPNFGLSGHSTLLNSRPPEHRGHQSRSSFGQLGRGIGKHVQVNKGQQGHTGVTGHHNGISCPDTEPLSQYIRLYEHQAGKSDAALFQPTFVVTKLTMSSI